MRRRPAVRAAWAACTNARQCRKLQDALHETTKARLGNPTGPLLFRRVVDALITIRCHWASFHVEWTPEPQHIVKLTNSRLTNPQEIVIGRCEHETFLASV